MVSVGTGWNPAGLQRPQPLPTHCDYRLSPFGNHVLPDLRCTPGSVTRASLDNAAAAALVCHRSGAPIAAFPPPSLVARYLPALDDAYRIPPTTRDNYTYAWLIPANLGGSATLANLWPVPRNSDTWDPTSQRTSERTMAATECAAKKRAKVT